MANKSTELDAIRRDELYPLEIFEKRVGLGRGALRAARMAGLRTMYVSGRAYILGEHWFQYVAKHGKERTNDTQ